MRTEASPLPARTNRAAPPLGTAATGEPLHAVSTLVTGKRYLLLSVLATGIAVASTYQRLLALSPADWHELLLEHEGNTTTSTSSADVIATTVASSSSSSDDAAAVAPSGIESLTVVLFVSELMRSRVSAAIVMHFYSVLMYHVFLVVAHSCFGAIRPAEIQHTKETMIHFILMRCLLLASTMGAGQKTKMGLLLVWLSAVAFLRGILSLCSARFEHLLTRPMAQLKDLHRLALALGAIIACDVLLATACAYTSVLSTLVVHFAWFEASLLLIKTLQLGTQVAFHVLDVGNSVELGAERSEFYLLVLQTTLSACYLLQLVLYYLYIISVDQFRVSFLDFILIINVKNATVALLEHARNVQVYHRVVMDLDAQFPDATPSELAAVSDDVCVICLKAMDTHAKKLQCGHLFHRFCLRQCLQRASVGDAFTHLDTPVRGGGGATGVDFDTGAAAGSQRAGHSALRCPICRKHVHTGKPEPHAVTPAAQAAGLPDALARARTPVDRDTDEEADAVDAARAADAAGDGEPEMEEVIRFSTEFISRWVPFPNFSFEIVRHRHGAAAGAGATGAGAALVAVTPEMVQHVWEVFPQYSVEAIHADLQFTRSPERTIERILSGEFDAARPGSERGDGFDDDDGALAHAIDDMDDELRWSVSTLWSNLWHAPTPLDRNGHNGAEHIALPETLGGGADRQIRGSGDSTESDAAQQRR